MTEIKYTDQTDSVAEKVRLLQQAYAANNPDLAMSLADSIRATLSFERQRRPAEPADVAAGAHGPVADLPGAWAAWARGWNFYQPVTLFETAGIGRQREPVDLAVAFRADQTTDLEREVRLARCDSRDGALYEVPVQVYAERRTGSERRCRLVFLAEVPAHEHAKYLIFSGNANAERADYTTDLRVCGDGYGLDIANAHYRAILSRQTGQIERIVYARQHGLELYAGGKGHGEPPTIDWGHDYVDGDGFQKLRMRNWPRCPNYEVVQGPLCVRVRRWGFPYSPLHPVFTPSRIHMDVTYTFYAGVPYFFKQSHFDVVKDVSISAMRDDEWVFSGYSFTETVWIDRFGKLHEGAVPAAENNDLWGVGFVHPVSRDAFIALRLDHSAEKFDALAHGGVPTLHYDGHGQLWSRYPVTKGTRLPQGASIRQKNAYLLAAYPAEDAATEIETVRHRLMSPLQVQAGDFTPPGRASAVAALARHGETAETATLKPQIWETLREVKDEQFYKADANAVDMGYVLDVRVRAGTVRVLVTMPHHGRPRYEFLVSQGGGRVSEGIRERLLKIKGVEEVVVELSWNPPWTADRLTPAGRRAMGLAGET